MKTIYKLKPKWSRMNKNVTALLGIADILPLYLSNIH